MARIKFVRYAKQLHPAGRPEPTTKEQAMTKAKNDVPDPEGGSQATKPRGGAAGEDRSKDMTAGQDDGPFGNEKEGKAGGEKNASGERKR
ncbi:MAG TPA: hypothetical protein VGC87_13835 [Pyrinomonadaceae bacterium]